MQEKIGAVTLELTWYSGEDQYSDGAKEEQELLEIAQSYSESELNRVIAQRKSWPALYHFSHIRQNIVQWLPITKNDRVLEIGSGCGAVTGALARLAGEVTCVELSKMRSSINANRNKDCGNLTILVGNFKDIEEHLETYDYITLIGVLEYSALYMGGEHPFEEMLRCAARHLAPGGTLVLAIENRLGLKYWAGCTEDHTGLFFEGLENYSKTKGIRTFSRAELLRLLQNAGFSAEFHYPYPDYKFPMTIYSDSYLPRKGELNGNFCNYDRPRAQLFDEAKVYDSLVEGDLFRELSNSFLVLAKEEAK